MAIGDSDDVQARLQSLIPNGWFNSLTAPVRDIVFGGLADSLSWIYALRTAVRAQMRIATASGWFLDLVGWDFFRSDYLRKANETDDSWRKRIIYEIFRERVTRKGIIEVLEDLTGQTPDVFEPANPGDCGGGYGVGGGIAYGGANPNQGLNSGYGSTSLGGYGEGEFAYFIPSGIAPPFAGAGAYGSISCPYQFFVTAYRPQTTGIPYLDGYGGNSGGYGVGTIAYADISQVAGSVLDSDIYDAVARTVAAGITAWVAIKDRPGSAPSDTGSISLDFSLDFQDEVDAAYVFLPQSTQDASSDFSSSDVQILQ